jgi:hypothetical protein
MPIEGNILNTKAVNVKQRQELLLVIHNEPWAVEKMWVNERGEIMVKMLEMLHPIALGDLKGQYNHLLRTHKMHIRSWRTTGGELIPGFVSERGHLLSYIGLNLNIVLSEPKPHTSNKQNDGIERARDLSVGKEPQGHKTGVPGQLLVTEPNRQR